MDNYKGIEYLRSKLALKRNRVLLRYIYYEMKNNRVDAGNVIPAQLKEAYKSTLGWCAKAVDSLADRLIFDGFKDDNFITWIDTCSESAIDGLRPTTGNNNFICTVIKVVFSFIPFRYFFS